MYTRNTRHTLTMQATGGTRLAAFSLAELVVSVGILVLMLSLVGQVFHLTVQSTGQATALTEVTQSIRAFEQTLRDDLAGVARGRSALLIQGSTINAYLTSDDKENADPSNASDPFIKPVRADLLLFYTGRRGNSYIQPDVTSNVQQVVYGHAELGEWTTDAGDASSPYGFAPVSGKAGTSMYGATAAAPIMPASRWHLGRRSTLLLPTPAPATGVDLPLSGTAANWIVDGRADVLGRFDYEAMVLRPFGESPWFLPEILSPIASPGTGMMMHERSMVDATPPSMLMNAQQKFYGMGHNMLPACASFKVEWALDPRSSFVDGRLDGLGEMLWFDPGDQEDATRADIGAKTDADPIWALEEKILSTTDEISSSTGAARQAKERLLAQLISLRDTRICEVDPLSSRVSDCEIGPGADPGRLYSLAERFRGRDYPGVGQMAWQYPGGAKTLAFFGANRPRWKLNPPGGGTSEPDVNDTVPDPMFPGALRITVEVFDDQQRLGQPVRHVMVIPLGE